MSKIRVEAHAPLAAAIASLVVGVGLYAAVSKGDLGASPASARQAVGAGAVTADVGGGDGAADAGGLAVGSTGAAGSFTGGGSTSPAGLLANVLGEPVAGVAPDTASTPSTPTDVPEAPGAPDTPDVPACPTDEAVAQADGIRREVADAVGQPVPGDALGDLAAVAAGCSTESPTGPVLRLALELARLVPDSGLPPVQTPNLPLPPPPPAPVPPEVVEALRPAEPVILEACGAIGMLGLLVGLVPGAANVPLYDSNAVTVIGYGAALCGQFEPPT